MARERLFAGTRASATSAGASYACAGTVAVMRVNGQPSGPAVTRRDPVAKPLQALRFAAIFS